MRTLAIAVVLACAAAGPSWSGDSSSPPSEHGVPAERAGEPGHGAEAAETGKEIKLRLKFDKDSAKGEITCKAGKLKGDSVEFEKCLKNNLSEYKEIAILKEIVSREKYEAIAEEKKELAKKLAFLDSAHKSLKEGIEELGPQKADTLDYKKALGAKKKIDKELCQKIDSCHHEAPGVFKCPSFTDLEYDPAKNCAAKH